MKFFLNFAIALLVWVGWSHVVLADRPGDLDPGFNGTGIVTTSVSGSWYQGFGVAVQADNKIVVAGRSGNDSNIAVLRYNPDGSLDPAFNGAGIVTTSVGSLFYSQPVVVQPDGKIVVVGNGGGGKTAVVVIRYLADGSPDPAFNGTGIVTTSNAYGRSVTVQADGKIVVAGSANNNLAAVRYNADGSLDTAFNSTGIVTTAIGSVSSGVAVAVQADGKIVVAGNKRDDGGSKSSPVLVRYKPDGSLDETLNNSGIVITAITGKYDRASSVAIQTDGKIVVAGDIDTNGAPRVAVIRYNPDGGLDTTFKHTGIVTTAVGPVAYGVSVAVQANGKPVVAGACDSGGSPRFMAIRYNPDGNLDYTFNGTGIVTTTLNGTSSEGLAMALDRDGKIVVAGFGYNGDIAVVRYLGGEYPFSLYLPVIFKM